MMTGPSSLLLSLLAAASIAAAAEPALNPPPGGGRLKSTVEHLRERLLRNETKNNVKCWTTFRRTEDIIAGVPVDPAAGHVRARLTQKFARELWLRSNALEPAASKAVSKGSVEKALRQFLKIGVLLDKESFEQKPRFLQDQSALKVAGLDAVDLGKTSESWRVLLSVAQADAAGELRELSPEAADLLSDDVNLFAVSLLKVAAKLCRSQNAPKITAEVLERADSMIHFREIYYHFSNIGAGMDKRLTLPQSIWFAEDKLKSLENVNEKAAGPVHARNMEDIAGMPLDEAVPGYIDEAVLPSLARMIWLKSQLLLEKGALLIPGEQMQKASEGLFPYRADEEENITYFPDSPKPVTLLAYQCDAFRDDGVHWAVIRDLLLREIDLESKDARTLNTPPDPYAMEELSEALSDLPTLALHLAGEAARKAKRDRVGVEDVKKALAEIKERSRQAQEAPRTRKLPAPPAAGEDPLLAWKGALFINVTARTGVSDLPVAGWWKALNDAYWRFKMHFKEQVRLAYGKLTGKEIPYRNWNLNPSVDKFAEGAAAEDFDNDGMPDIFIGGKRGGLFRNLGGMRFENVSWKAGLAKALASHPRGAAFGDFDNDGWQDLIISPARGYTMLYRNNGNGTFTDVTERSGIRDRIQNVALWLDYDKDGWLDLYLLNRGDLEKGAIPFIGDATNAEPKQLYRNNGDGTFTDVTKEAGVGDTRWALAGAVLDYDNDGWPDIYVDNDIGKDVLYHNLRNGKFEEVTEKAGVADYGAGMGISVGDFNHDGWPDLYGTNIGMYSVRSRYVRPNARTRMQTNLQLDQYFRIKQANRLYRNNRNGTFTNVVDELMGPIYTGWGWNGMFFDFDNDGWLDIHVSNGALPYNLFYHDERNVLIHQDPKTGHFHDVSAVSGVDFPGNSRGAAFADFDGDGFLDFVVIGIHPPQFFQNAMARTGNHWLSVRLRGTVSNRDSIGARIEVKSGGMVQTDWVGGQGGGLSSQCGKEIHFGLGKSDSVDWVKVRWPSGREKTLRGVKADRRISLVEPGPGRPARLGNPSGIPSLAR